jgi:hypothetical protein
MEVYRGRPKADEIRARRKSDAEGLVQHRGGSSVATIAGAVSWMVSGHATWKAGPLVQVTQGIPESGSINNVDQQLLAMAFAIVRYFGDKS